MTQTTSDRIRRWDGPAILSFGFRPMFLLAGLWAAGAMVIWIAMLSGLVSLPTRFDPVTWHSHEFLFGYLGAVIAGFLLTAVPNWTGRLPVVGWHLAGLTSLWIVGRLAIMFSTYLPVWAVTGADLMFSATLWLVILREIIAGKNWRNLPVLALVGVLILANLIFHLEAANGEYAAKGFGLRLGLSVILVLVALIGGKIIPSFTRNWLVKQGATGLPTPPMQLFDKVTLLATVATLLGWTIAPESAVSGAALIAIAVLHGIRLSRWRGVSTTDEPLVWVLHAAYAFVPLGALLNAVAILAPQMLPQGTAIHVWTAGAIGLMTLAVMSRATLGHSGHALHADRGTTLVYLALVGSVTLRVAADFVPMWRTAVLDGSGLLWIVCFAGFTAIYGPMLLRKRKGASA